MKITTAIFDLDGTLLNTLGDLGDSVNVALAKHGFPTATEEQTRQRVGDGIRMLMTRSLPEGQRSDAVIDSCLDDFRVAYEQRLMNRTQPYDGIMDTLKALKENHIAVGVLSNKYDLAAKTLIRHYFGNLCQITMGERPDMPRKPDPKGALSMLKELGGTPENTLYIGDSAVDIETAHNAGLTAVGVTWGFRSAQALRDAGADILVDQPKDLLPLFQRGLIDMDTVGKAFTRNGFAFQYFPTAAEAAAYIREKCSGKTVTLGGSITLKELGFPGAFDSSTTCFWHWLTPGVFKQNPDVYICSANALSETGEVVNIDGAGNRVAGTLFGPKECLFVCGTNKLCPDLPGALYRARNVAAPLNAKRLGSQTPCAADGKCHDCKTPARICRALTVLMAPPLSMKKCEIVLIGEKLGY